MRVLYCLFGNVEKRLLIIIIRIVTYIIPGMAYTYNLDR